MATEPITIRTPKLSDDALVTKWLAFASALQCETVIFRIHHVSVCPSLSVQTPEDDETYAILQKFLVGGGAYLAATMSFSKLLIRYDRATPFDTLTIPVAAETKDNNIKDTAQILSVATQHLEQIDLDGSMLQLLGDDLKRYYEQREAELIRLQQLTEQLIRRNDEYRHKVDEEKLAYQRDLDEHHQSREEALNARHVTLDKREEEMELADAKSARRKIRHDILKALKPEAGSNLTAQTLWKTWPLHLLFLLVAVALGVAAYLPLEAATFDPKTLKDGLRVGLPFFGLLGTLLYYVRWMDSLLRKNVSEELRFRQLAIDVDRASWVVEVLAELREENLSGIPDEVLGALTRNLFIGPSSTGEVTHPAQDMLAALLGSARAIELDFPGGRIKTDGRRMRKAAARDPENKE